MATYFWSGGETSHEGEFDYANNWLLTTGAKSSTVPTTGDTIIFDGRADTVYSGFNSDWQTVGNHWSMITNIDLTSINFAKIEVRNDYTGNIGYIDYDTPTYTFLGCTADSIVIEGEGTYYLKAKGVTDEIVVNCEGSVYLQCDASGDITTAKNYKGTINMIDDGSNGINVTNYISYSASSILATESGAIDNITVYNGSLYVETSSTAVTINNGNYNIGSSTTLPTTDVDITALTVNGGSVSWLAGGTISDLDIYGGSVAVTGSAPKQLGHDTSTTVISVNGGTLNLSCDYANPISLGADTTIKLSTVGSLVCPINTSISW